MVRCRDSSAFLTFASYRQLYGKLQLKLELGADRMNFKKGKVLGLMDGCCLAWDVACTGDFRAVNVTVREPCLAVSARSCSVAEC